MLDTASTTVMLGETALHDGVDVRDHSMRLTSKSGASIVTATGRLLVLTVMALSLPSSSEAFVARPTPTSSRWMATSPLHDRPSGSSTILCAKGKRRSGQQQETASQPEVRRSLTPTRGDTILHFRDSDVYQHSNLQQERERDNRHSDDEKLQWRSWFTSGLHRNRSHSPGRGHHHDSDRRHRGGNSRYGNGDVRLREDKRLGGLPRAIGYSSSDWWHNILTLPSSGILKEIRSPVSFMMAWGTGIATMYHQMKRVYPIMASHMAVPVQPHALVVSVLGLLLVFRTNSAYQRFVEGRKIWEDILSTSRDLFRMVSLFEASIGTEKKRNVSQLLAAFPYLLRHRVQPHKWMRQPADPSDPSSHDPENTLLLYDDKAHLDTDYFHDEEDLELETGEELRRRTRDLCFVDKRTLPWRLLPKAALGGCARAQNRPLWVCDRIAKELMLVKDDPKHSFTNRERMALLAKVDKLSHCIGQCERIHQTVVPLNYARHSLRSLSMWLLTLPFALVKDLGFFTGPMLAFMSWLLFGVYEIGCSIEDPFQGSLRLSILCDGIRRDVLGEDLHRDTAFQLSETEDEEDEDEGSASRVLPKNVAAAASRVVPMNAAAAAAAMPLVDPRESDKAMANFGEREQDQALSQVILKSVMLNGTDAGFHNNVVLSKEEESDVDSRHA